MSWTNEDLLLLYFCRIYGGTDKEKALNEEKRRDIDWDDFLNKARENGISGIVYFALKKISTDYPRIPAAVFEGLKKDYYKNAISNTLVFEELEKILDSFRKCRLPVIILKGAALASIVYGNLALRPMSDVDLLVRKEDLLSMDKQFGKLGYGPSDMSVHDVNLSSTYLTTLDYRSSKKKSLSFHVHWHFVNSTVPNESYIKKIHMDNIWQDSEKVNIAEVESRVMAPHHFLIHLSEHALRVRHSLDKFIYLCDIHEVIKFYEKKIDWSRLIHESLQFNLSRMIYISLYFTSHLLGTKIPKEVLFQLKPKKFHMGEKLFIKSISKNDRIPGLSYLIHLSLNHGNLNKMRFIWRTLFPPRQILAQRTYVSQSNLSFLHYFHRIKEVFSHFVNMLK